MFVSKKECCCVRCRARTTVSFRALTCKALRLGKGTLHESRTFLCEGAPTSTPESLFRTTILTVKPINACT